MGAELVEFYSVGRVSTVLGSGIPRHTSRSLVWIGTTLSTFQRNNDPNALSHSLNSLKMKVRFQKTSLRRRNKHKPLSFHTTLSIGNYFFQLGI